MTDEFLQTGTPAWPEELAEPVARLGPPLDVFRIPRQHASRKAFSGVALLLLGGLANYLYWFVWNGFFLPEHLLILALVGPIISGVCLIYAAWRDRGLWVLTYPMGLLRWQRGTVVTFPWNELVELAFFRVMECDRPRRTTGLNGEILTSWLPIAKMGSRTLGAHLILHRDDGAEAILPSSLNDFARLCRVVQEETFRSMWPRVWGNFIDGNRVKFGEVALSLGGIHRNGDFLPWYELEDALVLNGKLVIRSRVLRRSWAEILLQNVSNPHVFVALLITGPPPLLEVEQE